MGIYSSNVLRESYSVTDFASQIEPDENYNAVTGCAMAFLESQQNDLALFNATIANDFQEVAALQEGYEVINESVASVFEKIKEILKKLIAKIKGIFQSFLAKLRGTFSSNKDLYDDYVKQINKYYNWKDFKVKKFRKKKVDGDIGAAIQEHAHKNGYSVVVDFCGHGVGNAFHEDPYVHHVGIRNTGMVIAPGMVFTIEPMINQGTRDLYIDKDNGWTSYTKDGKLSAQWENTILVTEKGIEVLAW